MWNNKQIHLIFGIRGECFNFYPLPTFLCVITIYGGMSKYMKFTLFLYIRIFSIACCFLHLSLCVSFRHSIKPFNKKSWKINCRSFSIPLALYHVLDIWIVPSVSIHCYCTVRLFHPLFLLLYYITFFCWLYFGSNRKMWNIINLLFRYHFPASCSLRE